VFFNKKLFLLLYTILKKFESIVLLVKFEHIQWHRMNTQQSTTAEKATILIPTYNRPKELHRLLQFLKLSSNAYPIVVLDGSTQANQQINRKVIAKFENIACPDFPENMHMSLRIAAGLNDYVTTSYSIICADDDYVIPATIAHCINFLDTHPDYSTANGYTRCLAYPKKHTQHGFFALINHLRHPLDLDQPTFLARYLNLIAFTAAGCPPLFYALRRTEQARKIFNYIPASFKYSSQELLSDALTSLWGKSTTLPHLLTIRDYSSETTRDANREDPVYYFSQEDAVLVREILKQELSNSPERLSEELIEYTLDQFIKLPWDQPIKLFDDSDVTPLMKFLRYKKNWFFYLLNSFFPTISAQLDLMVSKEFLINLRQAFREKYAL
jgi:glycosyltransferase domain-containing protein